MFNLKYRSHRILRDFFEMGSEKEIVDWKAYGYLRAKSAYETLRVSCEKLDLPAFVTYEKREVVIYRNGEVS